MKELGLTHVEQDDPFLVIAALELVDGRIAYLEERLGSEELDEEYAFEMLDEIFVACASRGEYQRFLALVDRVEQERPEIYRSEETYLLGWKVNCGLALSRPELVAEAARAFAEHGAQIDLFDQMLDKIAFAGELDLLLEARRRAWDDIADADDIFDGGANYINETIDLELLAFVLENPDPESDPTPLLERIAAYREDIRTELLRERLPFLYGLTKEESAADLARSPAIPDDDDDEHPAGRAVLQRQRAPHHEPEPAVPARAAGR